MDGYDAKFLCTYKQHDDDDLYRLQFLEAFKLKKWNDTLVRDKMDNLFDKIHNHFFFLIEKIKTNTSVLSHMMLFLGDNPNDIDVFKCLFCADVFQETHRCIADIIHFDEIKSEHYKALENVLFN
jgi:hypothetical protein